MGILDIFKISKIKQENETLKNANAELNAKMRELGVNEYYQTQEKIASLERDMKEKIASQEKASQEKLERINAEIAANNRILSQLRSDISELQEKNEKLTKSCSTQEKKLSRIKELYKSADYSIKNFFEIDIPFSNCKLSSKDFDDLELISPSVTLKLHCMDVKSLKQAYRDNEKQINKVLDQYSSRYTTKANKSIYTLMVIALRAELQNILYNLKYEKLDKSVEDVKNVSAKYLQIAGDGNQSIAGTLTKFIGEIEYLFINAVKIEYNYYVKKEQARQEQLAIKEQMRQEAEERKALEAERKKVEQEEAKYEAQISALTEQALSAKGSELEALKARILELQSQLANVVVKREEISKLQNGKAGNVYIISNLGSFGDHVFKIGMTRRLNPQERIDELGSASVPFRFDVHSFIFSDDASSLETNLHKRLNSRRVNKVNLRKEFFNVSIDELEELVTEICPTAEFNRTMIAEEFHQSLSSDEVYSSDYELKESEEADMKPQDSNYEKLYTKWGTFKMPEPYTVKLAYGLRNDTELINR